MAVGGGPLYRVELTPTALKQLRDLPRPARERITPRIHALANNPRPHGSEKLKGEKSRYRIRVGNYRVIYMIHDDRLIVTVTGVADRRDAYRP